MYFHEYMLHVVWTVTVHFVLTASERCVFSGLWWWSRYVSCYLSYPLWLSTHQTTRSVGSLCILTSSHFLVWPPATAFSDPPSLPSLAFCHYFLQPLSLLLLTPVGLLTPAFCHRLLWPLAATFSGRHLFRDHTPSELTVTLCSGLLRLPVFSSAYSNVQVYLP